MDVEAAKVIAESIDGFGFWLCMCFVVYMLFR